MDNFVSRQNIIKLRKRLEAPADETRRVMLLKLLDEEEAKLRAMEPGRTEPTP